MSECKNSLKDCLAFHSRDWSVEKRDAWLYGIIIGWDDDSLTELMLKHQWTPEQVERLKRLHVEFTFTNLDEVADKPLPEPVAYAALDKDTGKATFWSSRKENVESYIDGKDGFYLSAIYAEPQARQPLSDVEISKAFCDETGVSIGDTIEDAFEAGVRFAEDKHGIKEQE